MGLPDTMPPLADGERSLGCQPPWTATPLGHVVGALGVSCVHCKLRELDQMTSDFSAWHLTVTPNLLCAAAPHSPYKVTASSTHCHPESFQEASSL